MVQIDIKDKNIILTIPLKRLEEYKKTIYQYDLIIMPNQRNDDLLNEIVDQLMGYGE